MDKDIISTSVVATADDDFHATWGVLITTWPEAVGIGVSIPISTSTPKMDHAYA